MSEATCLLCRVVRGELAARKFVETERAIGVINDAEPLARGHLVFFPRLHAARLHEAADADLAELITLARRAAAALGLEHYNLLQNNGALAGQTVFHVHLHLIPRWSETEGLRYERPAGRRIGHGDLFERLRSALANGSGTA